jgi:glycosyltransferase involved in cell wall biosynthesis
VRPYVRNDSFFKAIPLVLAKRPDAKFLCSSMQGEAQAHAWVRELGIESAVELMPPVPFEEMGNVFRRAQIVVSPSVHDGTPNSLIEAMACGCFPLRAILNPSASGSRMGKTVCWWMPQSAVDCGCDFVGLGKRRPAARGGRS